MTQYTKSERNSKRPDTIAMIGLDLRERIIKAGNFFCFFFSTPTCFHFFWPHFFSLLRPPHLKQLIHRSWFFCISTEAFSSFRLITNKNAWVGWKRANRHRCREFLLGSNFVAGFNEVRQLLAVVLHDKHFFLLFVAFPTHLTPFSISFAKLCDLCLISPKSDTRRKRRNVLIQRDFLSISFAGGITKTRSWNRVEKAHEKKKC